MFKPVCSVAIIALFASFTSFADVTVESPYVRAMPPGQKVTGAFMILNNSDAEARAVVSAESDVAAVVELHTHENKDGMMQMRQIPQIDVAAGGSTTLKPGGLHVMLIDMKKPLKEGDVVDITLVLDNGEKLTIAAPVKTVTGGMNMKGMKHDMKGSMKGGMGKKDAANMAMKHANPVPNYMSLVMKMSDKLQLNDEQVSMVKQWKASNSDSVAALVKSIVVSEKKLAEQSMSDAPAEVIMQSASETMALRLEMVERKTKCRDNLKTILNEAQYETVLSTYASKMGV